MYPSTYDAWNFPWHLQPLLLTAAVNHPFGGWNTVDFGGCISGSEHRSVAPPILFHFTPLRFTYRAERNLSLVAKRDKRRRTLITGWVGWPGSHWLTDWMPQWMDGWMNEWSQRPGLWIWPHTGVVSPTDARWNRIIIIDSRRKIIN